jgi:hypothetical protein
MLKALIILLTPSLVFAEIMVGTATTNKNIVYQEIHTVSYTNSKNSEIAKIATEYRSKDNKIGYREQEFVSDHFIPNLVFKDETSQETYSITVNGKLAVLRTFFESTEKSMEFKVTKDQVTTASISKYIFENFDKLLDSPQVVKCLIPRSHRFVALKIAKSKVKNGLVTFSVQPSSLLLKLFASKTFVTFDLKSKYWNQYVGFSNLKNKEGQIAEVQIDYKLQSPQN